MLFFNDIPPYAQKNETGFFFWIKVTPKASKNRIGDLVDSTMGRKVLKVYVTSPPEDNLANIAVVELLAEYLHMAKSKIQIVSGHTMREKRIQVFT
jgi:uncharacterized protein (TIGR00251 family)